MSYILSGDAAIYYEEYGTGDSLVLLPGLLGSLETQWRRFLPDFARHFHVVAPDLRGHGRTNNPSRLFRLSQLTDDLHRLLDTLQIERCFLCGYDLGGYIAIAFALRHPEKVSGLVMHGTRFYWTDVAVAGATAGLHPDRAASASPEWTAALMQEHLPGNGPDGWRATMDAARAFLAELPSQGIRETELVRVRPPVLVSVCRDDELVPAGEAERVAKALPAGRLQVIEGCAHTLRSVPRQPFLTTTIGFLRTCAGDAAR